VVQIAPNVPPVYATLARIGATKFGRSGARKARSKTRVHLFIHARALYRLLAEVQKVLNGVARRWPEARRRHGKIPK